MTGVLLLTVGLVAAALLGPLLLRGAAPMLARVPRLAVFILFGGVLMWIVAVLAVGPILAWFISGPSLLPEEAAAVCQRCLVSASP